MPRRVCLPYVVMKRPVLLSCGVVVVLALVVGSAASSSGQCGGPPSGGEGGCAEGAGSGAGSGDFDYSFDGMPKPHNWRELDEYAHLHEIGRGSKPSQATPPPSPRRRAQEAAADDDDDDGEEEVGNFDDWQKEMAHAEDDAGGATFLETRNGKFAVAVVLGTLLTWFLLCLKVTPDQLETKQLSATEKAKTIAAELSASEKLVQGDKRSKDAIVASGDQDILDRIAKNTGSDEPAMLPKRGKKKKKGEKTTKVKKEGVVEGDADIVGILTEKIEALDKKGGAVEKAGAESPTKKSKKKKKAPKVY